MQAEGLIGKLVAGMIRRSVRNRFHTVHWLPPTNTLSGPAVLYANHHGWMDGYLMFHVAESLNLRCLDWIEEFAAFPLFRYVGGMPFSSGNREERFATVRRSIELMNKENRSLVIFPEGVLHRPSEVLPFGKSLATIARHVSNAKFVPVALRYEMSLHERPEAWVTLGEPHTFVSLEDCRSRLSAQLTERPGDYEVLVKGKPDVNERMSMRRLRNA